MKSLLVIAFLYTGLLQAATLTPVSTNLKPAVGQATLSVWSAGATGDVGTAVSMPTYHNRSVQVTGTIGGATVNIEGSNDGTNYVILTDSTGTALSFTAAGFKQISQNARYIRPSIVGGAASAMVITLLSSK